MKFCFFNTTKLWGGGEKWHLDMAVACREKGHSVVMVVLKDSALEKRSVNKNIPVQHITLTNLSFLNPLKKRKICRYFIREKFDAVIFNAPKDLKVAASAAHSAHISKIIYRRGSAIPIKNNFLNRKNFSYLTDILANSEATKQTILQNNPIIFPAKKITVIYNGIDIHLFESQKDIDNEIPVIGNLGRCVYQKGQDLLLLVAEILKRKGIICRFKIGGEGALLNDLKKKAEQLDISEMVDFTGFIEKPDVFLHTIDIFALPSRWEGFGYAIAEAMASTKPVVAFDISSNPELIIHEETGFLVSFPNVEAFASAIEQLILDKSKRIQFGEAGLKKAKEYFDFQKNMQKTIAFLEQSNE